MARFTSAGGGEGTPGPQGPKGDPGDTPDLSSYAGDILPAADNTYVLGNSDNRWKSISIGEGTIYITDAALGTEVGITIDNGIFFIDGIAQAQLPDLAVTNLTFNDNTTQTTAYIPGTSGVPVETDYTVGGGSSGTQPQFNGAPLFDGSYVKHGPLVYFRVNVDMSNITHFGSGQYYVTIPFNSKYDYVTTSGHLHDHSTGKDYMIIGEVDAGSSQMNLFYTASNGQNDEFTQSSPIGLQPADFFHVSGTYIAE